MASSSSSAAASSSVINGRNRAAVAPAIGWPDLQPPPPMAEAHAVYVQELYRDPAPRPLLRLELSFLCRTITWGLLLFLAIASFSVLMWLIFHPTFPQLYVNSATMSAVTITGSVVTAECNITLLLTNPNRHLSTLYDRMEIFLVYPSQQVVLSKIYPPPFVQPRRNRTTIQINLSIIDVDLGNEVVKAMKQDLDRGTLSFEIKIFAVVRFRNGKWKTKRQFMRAYCGGVSFAFTSNNKAGIFLNPYQECEVYLYAK
ncbi:hypothetical protein CDL12_14432 [Handroanthus impetiginosus]|uniref:Uncharacterized protein n=1 Tax=Handroanthus impetiginosus TaxID=429701 RepID=A0A2G9H605_9LAMI|nr:hypothetical protein CDL12_14432 [Handroanthus impetiginosus]